MRSDGASRLAPEDVIARIESATVAVPAPYRVRSAVRSSDRIINVLVWVHTRDGYSGCSYVAAFTPPQARAIQAMLDELETHVVDLPTAHIGAVWNRMRAACRLLGRGGSGAAALSAIDTALWDIQGKRLGVPLHELLGTCRLAVPAYASDGCWLADDPDQTAREAQSLCADGFGAVKIRFGRPRPDDDLRTLDAVRAAVGPDVDVLIDVNQAWSLSTARRSGRRLVERGIDWLEEPLPVEHQEALATLGQELPLRIVAGESLHMPNEVAGLVSGGAVSVVMPDLQRIGGVTGWGRAQALAEVAGLEISSHLFPEVSIHLLAATSGEAPLEYVSWMQPFVERPLEVVDGVVVVPDEPGISLDFDWHELKKHVID